MKLVWRKGKPALEVMYRFSHAAVDNTKVYFNAIMVINVFIVTKQTVKVGFVCQIVQLNTALLLLLTTH